MAEQMVQPQITEPMEAITEHYIESGWKESPLPVGVRNRLARVERCLSGMVTINQLLMADGLGKADVADNGSEVVFPGALNPVDVEGLRLAAQELGLSAQLLLDAIRSREYIHLAAAHQ